MTFEHVPPRSANNRTPARMLGIEDWLGRDQTTGTPAGRGYVQQRGSGFYTLCDPCNNLAGRLYVPEYRRWIHMGQTVMFGQGGCAARFANEAQRGYALVTMRDAKPARFLKQMVTMLLAMSPESLGESQPDLRAFAQDPEWVGLPPEFQFYLALYAGPNARFVGGAAAARGLESGRPAELHFVYELAMPPFAYVLSLDEATPALETGNLSNFAHVGIHQTAAQVEMQMIVGYGPTPLPLDYRSPAALAADRADAARHSTPCDRPSNSENLGT